MAQFKQYKWVFDPKQSADQEANRRPAGCNRRHQAVRFWQKIEVYQTRGYESGYRTGRSVGVAYLEAPELKNWR